MFRDHSRHVRLNVKEPSDDDVETLGLKNNKVLELLVYKVYKKRLFYVCLVSTLLFAGIVALRLTVSTDTMDRFVNENGEIVIHKNVPLTPEQVARRHFQLGSRYYGNRYHWKHHRYIKKTFERITLDDSASKEDDDDVENADTADTPVTVGNTTVLPETGLTPISTDNVSLPSNETSVPMATNWTDSNNYGNESVPMATNRTNSNNNGNTRVSMAMNRTDSNNNGNASVPMAKNWTDGNDSRNASVSVATNWTDSNDNGNNYTDSVGINNSNGSIEDNDAGFITIATPSDSAFVENTSSTNSDILIDENFVAIPNEMVGSGQSAHELIDTNSVGEISVAMETDENPVTITDSTKEIHEASTTESLTITDVTTVGTENPTTGNTGSVQTMSTSTSILPPTDDVTAAVNETET